ATPDGARAAPAWSEDQPTAVTAAPATPPADAQTVLVVEDNADLRSFLERLLRPWWHVLVVADGQAALELVRERHPDLVLTDVMMPRLDGMGLLRELRADPATAGIPVLLLSARAGEESAVEGLGAGADDYLAKPFSGPELVARVRSNLELAGLRRRESEFRRALVEAMQDGLAVADADGTVVEVNAAFAEITGYGPEGLPYPWPPPWAIPDLVGDSTPESYRQMLTGAAGDVVVPIRRRDGERVWVSVNIASVTGRHGDRMHVLTVRDVTAERQARRRAAATQSFAAGLAAATTPYDVLVAGATGLAQVFGARRVVTTVRPVEAGLSAEDRSGTTADWPTRVAVGPPPDDEDDGPGTGGGDGAVGESGDEAGAGVGEGAGEGLADGGPVGLEPLVLAAMDSVLGRPGTVAVVPVTGAPGELSTALVAALGSDGAAWLQPAGPGGLTAEDQALFGLLAGHLSQALQRARRLDEARAVSLTLQHAILGPADLPPGFAARYHPAVAPLEVGGDWYDVLRLPTGRIAIVVGDCVGSGLAAAAVMGQLRSACRALLLRGDDPATALRDLDVVAGRTPGAVCTTVFCAVIDPAANLLHYSSAGHLPALVAHPPAPGGTGRAEVLSGGRSLPLGVRPGVRRPGATASLRPGSVLLLFTDGLVERRDRSLDIGLEQAAASFAEHAGLRCGELADRLLADLLPADGGQDDVALLVYRQPPEALRLELAPDPAMLAPLRRRAGSWLALAGLSEVQEHDVVLALTEAASNAVEHGHRDGEPGTVDVTLALEDGRLVVTVTDHGTWRTPEPVPGTRGRGLLMMRAFMDEVTVTPGAGGTTVRMVTALR
ncbi:MAG TPA: SpoIIE family protein phosphatase, partial [Pseudonocardiaceae bacterium]